MKNFAIAVICLLLMSSVSLAQVQDIESLSSFGAVSLQKYLDTIIESKRVRSTPSKSDINSYHSSWDYTIKAAMKFKQSYDQYESEYGILNGMNAPSYYLDYMRDQVKQKRNYFIGADIDEAHHRYVSQYDGVVNEANKKRQEVEQQQRKASAETQKSEALVFGIPLHSATKDQIVAKIKNEGGKLLEHETNHNKLRFDAKPFVPAAKQLVITYTNDSKISSYTYTGLSQQAANDLSQTLKAKYGASYANTKGMPQWNLKNGVSVMFLINTTDPFNPDMILVYQTKSFNQYVQEEKARREKADTKDAQNRKGNQAL